MATFSMRSESVKRGSESGEMGVQSSSSGVGRFLTSRRLWGLDGGLASAEAEVGFAASCASASGCFGDGSVFFCAFGARVGFVDVDSVEAGFEESWEGLVCWFWSFSPRIPSLAAVSEVGGERDGVSGEKMDEEKEK